MRAVITSMEETLYLRRGERGRDTYHLFCRSALALSTASMERVMKTADPWGVPGNDQPTKEVVATSDALHARHRWRIRKGEKGG
jgi:hypothetical protein